MDARSPSSDREGVREQVGEIRAIEGLRGIAVLWVVAFHYLVLREGMFDDAVVGYVNGQPALHALVRNGWFGVDLFFLITGFLLALPWFVRASRGEPAPAARDFWIRRIRRIVPAYYVQLAFLALVCLPLLMSWRFVKAEVLFVAFTLGAHATFLHYLTPLTSASFGINGALWSLALEAQYYLLLPFLAPLFVRRPLATAAAMVAIAIAWRWNAANGFGGLVALYDAIAARWQVPEAHLRHLLATQLPGYLAHFALGILCGRLWLATRGRKASRSRDFALAAGALAAFGALWAALGQGIAPLGPFSWLAWPLLLAAILACGVSGRPAWSDAVLAPAPLAWAGRVSYSAYLYHLPLLLLMGKLFPGFGGWLAFPAYLGILAAVSWLSWRFVEVPFLARRRPDSP